MPISKSLPIFNLTPVILKKFFKHIFEMGVNRKLGNSAGNRLFKCDCFSRWDFVPLCKLYDFYKDILVYPILGLKNPPSGGVNFTRDGFFSAGEHLRRSAFDHLQLCQIKKHLSVDIERQLVGSKSMTFK